MNKDALITAGVNYEEGLKRFANKAELYEKYLGRFPEDPCFKTLQTAMDEKNYEEAFKAAHALKGVVGNLSLNEIYNMVYEFVEYLRNNSDIDKAIASFPELVEEYNRMVDVINSQK